MPSSGLVGTLVALIGTARLLGNCDTHSSVSTVSIAELRFTFARSGSLVITAAMLVAVAHQLC